MKTIFEKIPILRVKYSENVIEVKFDTTTFKLVLTFIRTFNRTVVSFP